MIDSKMDTTYDHVILGGGMGGLVIGSLLAYAGKSVCLIEANSDLGGHAYTINAGEYKFCHDVQYLMGCQEGGPMRSFLDRIGLGSRIKFNALDPSGYDMICIEGKKIRIPSGMENYLKVLIGLYPQQEKELTAYFELEKKIFKEADGYNKVLTKKDISKAPWKYLTIIRYINSTLEDIFNKFKFPAELRAVLAARIGNLSASPREVSFLIYAAMDVAYSESAAFSGTRNGIPDR